MRKFLSLKMSKLLIGCMLNYYVARCSCSTKDSKLSTTNIRGGVQEHIFQTHAFRESIPLLSSRNDIVKSDRLHSDYVHEVIFVIRPNNMDELTRVLHDVSDPLSLNYGQHWTKQQIDILTSNPVACDAVVAYLHATGASVISHTLNSEYITAHAPISVWEKVFDTEFFTFHQTQRNGNVDKLVRAEKYWIPRELDMHLESVFNTIQMPSRTTGNLPVPHSVTKSEAKTFLDSNSFIGFTTPSKIKAYYNVGANQGSASSTQGVFSTINQYFSPADLSYFQNTAGVPNQPVSTSIGGYSSDSKCIVDANNCVEGNLDVQYIMATSPGSPTTFWYTDLGFGDWLVSVANSANPPLVFSISYGANENSMSASEMTAFSTQAIKLSTMGVSLVVASGDDGAVVRGMVAAGSGSCAYLPIFPASNPYVTSVGATSGVEWGTAEIVCQSDLGNSITSGGGFSAFYDQPTFQKPFVSAYFKAAAAAGTAPVSGYASGRGYPDITMAGAEYLVRIGSAFYAISGTSASAPSVAGFFSNINAARIAAGKGSIGWANPALYMNSTSFINDIVVGNNKCAADGLCCTEGFTATTGWDPASGLGSLDYGKLQSVFLTIGSSVNGALYMPTVAPTSTPKPVAAAPSTRPTTRAPRSPVPTRPPTSRPTSLTPTYAPTPLIHSYIEATQTASGVSASEAKDPSFTTAVQNTVSQAMGVQPSAVIAVTVLGSTRRVLLSSVTIGYTVSVDSGMTTTALVSMLQTSVSSGTFLTSLKGFSGLNITGVTGPAIANVSPTLAPTSAPVKQRTGISLTIILAVIGGGVGIIFVIIVCSIICCCCSRIQASATPEILKLENRRQSAPVVIHVQPRSRPPSLPPSPAKNSPAPTYSYSNYSPDICRSQYTEGSNY